MTRLTVHQARRPGLRNLRRGVVALLAGLWALSGTPATRADEPFFRAEPAIVSLKGFIVSKRFYGPPNHGEDPGSDKKVANWLLILNEPATIRFPGETEGTDEVATDVRRITLSPDRKGMGKALEKYLGQEVAVTGTLTTPFNRSFHWASIRMNVRNVALLPRTIGRSDEDLGIWRDEQATTP